jgi:type II secretory pathway pseudopilin PulG
LTRQRRHRSRSRSSSRAFTLIEVLVVIGIIIILLGIIAFGMSKVIDSQKKASTRNTLNVMRSWLAEYEITTKGLNRQPPKQWTPLGQELKAPGDVITIWTDGNPSDTAAPEPDPALAPRNVTKEVGAADVRGRYSAEQVGNTQQVLTLLQQAASVKTLMSQLATGQTMEEVPASLTACKLNVKFANGTVAPYSGMAGMPVPPLILDAWGNPIIFVPAGGLAGLNGSADDAMFVGGKKGDAEAKEVVRDTVTPAANQVLPIRSPDSRPFWASGGPDGNFLTGDDNLYSFEQ